MIKEITLKKGIIGFLTPDGIEKNLVDISSFSMINLYYSTKTKKIDLENIESEIQLLAGKKHRVILDITSVIAYIAESDKLNGFIEASDGSKHKKIFPALRINKIRRIVSDKELHQRLSGFGKFVHHYRNNISAIFLVDEPYLNGIPKDELERASRTVKKVLKNEQVENMPIGIIFAAGMFNKQFATYISRQANDYVLKIDDYYIKNKALIDAGADEETARQFSDWLDIIQSKRLTTYDSAGNMYIEGGIPENIDIVGFDFYLSTLLLDFLYENSLDWFAAENLHLACKQFVGSHISELRQQLSFFKDGLVSSGDASRQHDRDLLDSMYECRMGAILSLLKQEIGKKKQIALMLIGESSNNGLIEFDRIGVPEPGQPKLLIESRVLDEIKRSGNYYCRYQRKFAAGLMYFTYQGTFDKSVQLNIGGVKNMPSAMSYIEELSKKGCSY